MELNKGETHTLTMYYMERGMWESNMAVAYNFPDHNELQVEKKVDVSQVDAAFKPFFTDQSLKLFTINIRNQATHYGKVDASNGKAPDAVTLPEDFTACCYNLGSYQDTSASYLKKRETPTKEEPDTKYADQTVLWYAQEKMCIRDRSPPACTGKNISRKRCSSTAAVRCGTTTASTTPSSTRTRRSGSRARAARSAR